MTPCPKCHGLRSVYVLLTDDEIEAGVEPCEEGSGVGLRPCDECNARGWVPGGPPERFPEWFRPMGESIIKTWQDNLNRSVEVNEPLTRFERASMRHMARNMSK